MLLLLKKNLTHDKKTQSHIYISLEKKKRMSETFRTPLTELFGIKVPILLAGMNVAAGM